MMRRGEDRKEDKGGIVHKVGYNTKRWNRIKEKNGRLEKMGSRERGQGGKGINDDIRVQIVDGMKHNEKERR